MSGGIRVAWAMEGLTPEGVSYRVKERRGYKSDGDKGRWG